jgi:hypothetical protein
MRPPNRLCVYVRVCECVWMCILKLYLAINVRNVCRFFEVNLYFVKQNVKCRNSRFGFLLSVLLFVSLNENGAGARP